MSVHQIMGCTIDTDNKVVVFNEDTVYQLLIFRDGFYYIDKSAYSQPRSLANTGNTAFDNQIKALFSSFIFERMVLT